LAAGALVGIGCGHSGGAPTAVAAQTNPKSDGIDRHGFLYCSEWQTDRPGEEMYLVRGGKMVWLYSIPDSEELGDCTMMSNGHIVFVRKGGGAAEIVPDLKSGKGGEITWEYKAPPHTEVHSVQPIGLDKVLIMQNGTPPLMMIIDKGTRTVEQTFTMQAGPQVHGQFRHVRMTANGHFMVAHLNLGMVREYDKDGQTVLWDYKDAPSAWGT